MFSSNYSLTRFFWTRKFYYRSCFIFYIKIWTLLRNHIYCSKIFTRLNMFRNLKSKKQMKWTIKNQNKKKAMIFLHNRCWSYREIKYWFLKNRFNSIIENITNVFISNTEIRFAFSHNFTFKNIFVVSSNVSFNVNFALLNNYIFHNSIRNDSMSKFNSKNFLKITIKVNQNNENTKIKNVSDSNEYIDNSKNKTFINEKINNVVVNISSTCVFQ